MRRIRCKERANWRDEAARIGFVFHTVDGARYWDERAYYAFALAQIENDLEAATADLQAMCRELVSRAVGDERILRLLQIPEPFWVYVAESWKRGDSSLYGRMDLRYDGQGPAKLLEYNADTPTSAFETGVFQWLWLEDMKALGKLPGHADQFNSLHDKLVAAWREIGAGQFLHLACAFDSAEDRGTLAYLEDCARQGGLETSALPIERIGRNAKGQFVDAEDRPIDLIFKLYPWEWMLRETFGPSLPVASTRWVEPPWKMMLSNKGILPLLWAMFPGHPNLLPAYFDDDAAAAALGQSYVRKPLYSREGANIEIMVGGRVADFDHGPYGGEGFIRQALAPLPQFDGNYVVLGVWLAGGSPCALSIREDATLITKNTSRFLPHAIVE
jgi:glutathionylspermidine synthase